MSMHGNLWKFQLPACCSRLFRAKIVMAGSFITIVTSLDWFRRTRDILKSGLEKKSTLKKLVMFGKKKPRRREPNFQG